MISLDTHRSLSLTMCWAGITAVTLGLVFEIDAVPLFLRLLNWAIAFFLCLGGLIGLVTFRRRARR